MPFPDQAVDDLTEQDIGALVANQVIEDSTIEFKQELEIDASGRVKDGSRNDIAREIVAFANSDGGALIIGIEETSDDPKRAKSIKPIKDCHDLAERLRRAVYEIIEPKLPMLHSRAIDIGAAGGVIVFVLPHSRRAPHRVESTKECYRRVGSESRKITMREIQELTLAVANEADGLNKRFDELTSNFAALMPKIQTQMEASGKALQVLRLSAVPLTALSLPRFTGGKELQPASASIKYTVLNVPFDQNFPWGRDQRSTRRPIVRGERRTAVSQQKGLIDEIHNDGSVEITTLFSSSRLYFGWVLTQLAALLVTIDSLRVAAGNADAEYAIEMTLETSGTATLKLGGETFYDDEYRIDQGLTKFPRYSYGFKAERSALINEVAQDLVHSVGCRMDLALDAEIQE